MSPQRIQPYPGMYPEKVVQVPQHMTFNQEEGDSIDSFDLDFFATEKTANAIEGRNTPSFANKIICKDEVPSANEEEHKENLVERKHGCQVCLKRFKTKWHLTEHMIVHTGIYPFQCESCNKGFKRRKAFDSHPCIYDDSPEKNKEDSVTMKQDFQLYKCANCDIVFNMRTSFLKHICKTFDDDTEEFALLENDNDAPDQKKEIIFKEPHGEAVEIGNDSTPIQNQENDFYKDTLQLEDGIDAIANLTGLSIREVNETIDYFCQKFDPNEKDHKEAVEILNTNAVKIRHKTQDESESAIEMFNL